MRYNEVEQELYVHETSPEKARSIEQNGFRANDTGIFFNTEEDSYTGGTYGKSKVYVQLNLNNVMNTDEYEVENMDGYDLAKFAVSKGFDGWMDDLQIAILNTSVIKIVKVEI